MEKFGYLDDDVIGKNRGPLDPNSTEFRASIRKLQRFGNIPVTGRIDAATIKLINTDRCGVKDPPPDAAGRFTLQGSRWKRTVRKMITKIVLVLIVLKRDTIALFCICCHKHFQEAYLN